MYIINCKLTPTTSQFIKEALVRVLESEKISGKDKHVLTEHAERLEYHLEKYDDYCSDVEVNT